MNIRLIIAILYVCLTTVTIAQRRGGEKSKSPSESVPTGVGIAWYTDWELAVKEAKRSKRPIFFMAATSQCGGVPGVF